MSLSVVHPSLQIQRWILTSSKPKASDSELEAGEFIVFRKRPFDVCSAILFHIQAPEKCLPLRARILIQDSQEVHERGDRCARCSEVAVSQPLGTVLHKGGDRLIGNKISF